MNPELEGISEHMKQLGLGALAHANQHCIYLDPFSVAWHELSVLQAAHAAELLIKARIAEEHPLLIFESLPRNKRGAKILSVEDLFEQGRSIQWTDLPDRLWATTGITLDNLEIYEAFGKLRNKIQHFAVPNDICCASKTREFIYSVIDPFINSEWHLFAIDFHEGEDEDVKYIAGNLVSNGLHFLISPNAKDVLEEWDVDWETIEPTYRDRLLGYLSTLD